MSYKTKPETVKKALFLLYFGLVVAIIGAIWNFPVTKEIASTKEAQALGGLGFALTVQFITLVSLALLIWLISKRKNWARWIFSIMTVLGVPMMIGAILEFNNAPLNSVIHIVSTVTQIAAVVLLFLKPSREWFKKAKNY